MALGSTVQMYRVCNETTQTGVWRHAYGTSTTVATGWQMERALGRLYEAWDSSLVEISLYKMDLTANGETLTYYRLSRVAPDGWTLVGPVGYFYEFAPSSETTVPLYQLSYQWNGNTLYFHTTSKFERDHVVASDGMSDEGVIGYMLPASLSMEVSTSGTPGLATSTPSGQIAELKLGDSLEISLDTAAFGASGSITQVRFYTQDPDQNPGAMPAYTFNTGSSGIVNETIGGAQYRMWSEGNSAFLIANHEGASLVGNRQPVWFQLDATDSSGNSWTLDPELINDAGDAGGGPGWTVG